MNCLKMIIILTLMPLFLFLSACGDSDSSHTGSWENASLLADSARFPQVGSDANGNMIAVWAQSTGLYANRYDAISGWGTPQMIGDPSTGWSDLHLAVGRSGHAIVAWLLTEQRFSHLQVVRYTPGVGWGPVETLLGIGEPKDAAIDDNGNAFIVAEQFIIEDTLDEDVLNLVGVLTIARSDQESGWRYDRIEYADTSTSNGFPKISVDGQGNGFVLWVEGFNNSSKVYVSRLSQAGFGVSQQIASFAGVSGPGTNLLLDNNGNTMALWGQNDSFSNSKTYACRYTPADGWGAAERIDNTLFDTFDQSLAVYPSGNFHAVWTQRSESGLSDIYSCTYTPAGGWQTPLRVGFGGIARFPRIAADAVGNIFATWLQYDLDDPFSGDGKVYSNHFRAGTGWGTQQQLKNALGGADEPVLAVNQSGKAMVIWSQSTGYVSGSSEIKYGIFSSRFE
jgi:hypothetical protein